jgi:hypothetical protein
MSGQSELGLPAAPFWAAWNGALHAYATTFAGLALLDRAVTAVKIALLPLTDAAPIGDIASAQLTHSVIDVPIREALTLAAPVYYRHWWATHQHANQEWIDQTEPMLAQFGPTLLPQIARAFLADEPRRPLDVDVTTYVGWSGAQTTYYPPEPASITIDSTMASNQGWTALEVAMHEVAHTLVSGVRAAGRRRRASRSSARPATTA